MVEELKKKNVIAEDVFVDTRLFAMRSADHVRLQQTVYITYKNIILAN